MPMSVRNSHVIGSSHACMYDFGRCSSIHLAIIPHTSIVAIWCLHFSLGILGVLPSLHSPTLTGYGPQFPAIITASSSLLSILSLSLLISPPTMATIPTIVTTMITPTPKLNDSNWFTWIKKMKMVFLAAGLDGIASGSVSLRRPKRINGTNSMCLCFPTFIW